jgi:hypothetical protein
MRADHPSNPATTTLTFSHPSSPTQQGELEVVGGTIFQNEYAAFVDKTENVFPLPLTKVGNPFANIDITSHLKEKQFSPSPRNEHAIVESIDSASQDASVEDELAKPTNLGFVDSDSDSETDEESVHQPMDYATGLHNAAAAFVTKNEPFIAESTTASDCEDRDLSNFHTHSKCDASSSFEVTLVDASSIQPHIVEVDTCLSSKSLDIIVAITAFAVAAFAGVFIETFSEENNQQDVPISSLVFTLTTYVLAFFSAHFGAELLGGILDGDYNGFTLEFESLIDIEEEVCLFEILHG